METKKFLPKIDKVFFIIWIPTLLLLCAATVLCAMHPSTLWIMIPTDLFTLYFLLSPLFGYVELREKSAFIKFGFIMKRDIPYSKIRRVDKDRRWYTDSMLSLKCAMDHVSIRYDSFEVVCVSVVDNDGLIAELSARLKDFL